MPRKTVLVVEDDDHLREIFATNLTLSGFAVRQAANGMDALRFVDAAPPDVIVLDLGLPQVTGLDVLHEIKSHVHTREIPVIVVTGRDVSVPGTAARNLVRAGVPDTVAMKLTGHLTPSIFDRYNITSEDDLHDAARRLNMLHGTKKGQSGDSDAMATA